MAAGVFADFGNLILPFDTQAAHQYVEIVAERDGGGRPIATADAQIAAAWQFERQLWPPETRATSKELASASSIHGCEPVAAPRTGTHRHDF